MRRFTRHAHEIFLEFQTFLHKRYPAFVTAQSEGLEKDEVPIFVFHSIEPELFREQLEYLAVNRYRTVTADELSNHLSGKTRLPERSVLLTIDDGRSSVWTYAYPLLKKYGFTATVFLIPGYTKTAADYCPNLADCWSKKVALDQVSDRDKAANPLLTWEEIAAMHRSGVIDFQSHSLYHHKIFTSCRIVDFLGPDSDQPLYDLPLPHLCEAEFSKESWEQFWGMPIYASQPLLSGQARYFDDDELRLSCINYVQRNGGRDFFTQRKWRERLARRADDYKKRRQLRDRRATPQERDQEILHDLVTSKKIIEERLPGKVVRHFCFPYGIGSTVAVNLSKEAGYTSTFWSTRNERRSNHYGNNPFYCVRLKNDFIFRLPGEGRKSLFEIIKLKTRRRLSGELVY